MKGDFSRNSFNSKKHFSRVLMQQGRVMLDADHNEQAAILLHHLRTLARDLIGPYAAPIENQGFRLSPVEGDLQISAGRYYVDGILVENDTPCLYSAQPDYPLPEDDALRPAAQELFWVYLDVWERHVTPIEDDAIREKALGGPDTCTRAHVVWQVKVLPLHEKQRRLETQRDQEEESVRSNEIQAQIDLIQEAIDAVTSLDGDPPASACDMPLALLAAAEVKVSARVDPGQTIDDACVTPPDSKYRGPENQLYRVEIHQSGPVGAATFKWSRDNGSVATAWLGTDGSVLQVASSRGFEAGNWVELSDDTHELQGTKGLLVKLTKVEGGKLSVDSDTALPADMRQQYPRNPKVRRWDQVETDDSPLVDGALLVATKTDKDPWIDLEDGVQVRFAAGGEYRTGDYWLIPARVATGKIEWPEDADQLWQPPHGVDHHYAPLGFVEWTGAQLMLRGSCQCTFPPRSSCFNLDSFMSRGRMVKPARAVGLPKRRTVSPARAAKRKQR